MSKSFTTESLPTVPLLLVFGLSLVASLGCRTTSDNQIDLLERELRVQEDYIYELEDYVVEYSDKLRNCRSCAPPQMAAYSQEVYEPEFPSAIEPARDSKFESAPKYSSRSKSSPSRSRKSRRRQTAKEKAAVGPSLDPALEEPEEKTLKETKPDVQEDVLPSPAVTPDPIPEVAPEDLEAPDSLDFELGEPVSEWEDAQPEEHVAAAKFNARPRPKKLPRRNVLVIPDPVNFQSRIFPAEELEGGPAEELAEELAVEEREELIDDDQVTETAALVDRVAERLEVTQLFRGEGDELAPQNSSPQNLLTVVEALDANGEPVDLDGEVSLMVIQAKETADGVAPKRLKRWNFSAEETTAAWQSSDLGDGLHLELPLEDLALPEAPLELWVRLVTADGRKLLTQLPFEPSHLGDVAAEVPQSLSSGLVRTETETTQGNSTEELVEEFAESTNSLRTETASQEPTIEQPSVEQVSADQPRWRASMQRTDRTAEGFATTTSNRTTRWTTQAPGRQASVRPTTATAEVASRTMPVQAITTPAKPVWNSGRTLSPR